MLVGSELVASVSDADPGVGLPRAGLQGAAAAALACWQSNVKERESVGHFCPLPVSPHTVTVPSALSCLPPALFPEGDPKG